MRAKLFSPSRNPMQSGSAKTGSWTLEMQSSSAKKIDPLMGWTGSKGALSQVRLNFETKEAALEFAKSKGLEVIVSESKARSRKPIIRAGGYSENFAVNRRLPWTH